MDIKLGVMTSSMLLTPLEEMLRAVRKIGYQCVHIQCERPHLFPGDYSKDDRKHIRSLCDELNLEIVGLDAMHIGYETLDMTPPKHAFSGLYFPPNPVGSEPLFASPDPVLRKVRVNYVKSCIDMAVEMGVPAVETYTGIAVSCWDDIYHTTIESMHECVDYAASKKVMLVFEMGMNMMFGAVEEMLEIFKIIHSPWLKGCLDLAHVHIENRDIRDTLNKVGDYVINYHVADIRHRKHFHLPAGRGDINWKDWLTAIRDSGFKGSFCVETYPSADDPIPSLTESYNYLKPLIQSL